MNHRSWFWSGLWSWQWRCDCGCPGIAGFEHELTVAPQGFGHGLFQQGSPALHHAHPVAGHLHHGSVGIEPHQLALLRQQHPGGGQLQAAEDLLPQLGKVDLVWGKIRQFG